MKIRRLARLVSRLIWLAGILAVAVAFVSITELPWKRYRWLANPGVNAGVSPEYIVMMGGGGVPSESGLVRAWKTAEAAGVYPDAVVIVAMPIEFEESDAHGVEYELQMRGISPDRLLREPNGRNTREQALEVFAMLDERGGTDGITVGLVTSPEHMRRTWKSFMKAGMTNLVAIPSWAEDIKADLTYEESELGTRSIYGVVGKSMTFRYRMWDNLVILVKCSREVVGLTYYRLLGWI